MSNWPINGNLTGKLSIGQGAPGKSLEYMWRGTWLGIKREDEEEYQFVNLLPQGSGSGNNGADGREIELQVGNGFIQWRYVGEEYWNNLIALSALEGKQGLKGDKGDKGERGEKGEQGLQGLPGKDGKNGIDGATGSDGKSAYEIAISNGFKGTEQEWLNSLKGHVSGVATGDKIDYMGKQHDTLKEANDSNVEYLLRRVNTQKYEGSSITANNTYAKQVNNVILKGVTKYRDIDTGEFIDSVEEGKNLELVSAKSPCITMSNCIFEFGKGGKL